MRIRESLSFRNWIFIGTIVDSRDNCLRSSVTDSFSSDQEVFLRIGCCGCCCSLRWLIGDDCDVPLLLLLLPPLPLPTVLPLQWFCHILLVTPGIFVSIVLCCLYCCPFAKIVQLKLLQNELNPVSYSNAVNSMKLHYYISATLILVDLVRWMSYIQFENRRQLTLNIDPYIIRDTSASTCHTYYVHTKNSREKWTLNGKNNQKADTQQWHVDFRHIFKCECKFHSFTTSCGGLVRSIHNVAYHEQQQNH